jgi:hypothetical protein
MVVDANVLKALVIWKMDLDSIIHELLKERDRLDRIIRALEGHGFSHAAEGSKSRRGRKSMDAMAREQVSARMKQYWAKKREMGDSPTA